MNSPPPHKLIKSPPRKPTPAPRRRHSPPPLRMRRPPPPPPPPTTSSANRIYRGIQKSALLALKAANNYNPQSNDAEVCKWRGTLCDSNGFIVSLRLNQASLGGMLTTQIARLTALTSLVLGVNQLEGSIPSGLGSLRNLQTLYLNDNKFSGTIPGSIGQMTALKRLYLNRNQLSGSIPSQLGLLTNLELLLLNGNQFVGSVPSRLGLLSRLELLQLNDNQLAGPIAQQMSSLTNLVDFSIGSNNFTNICPFDKNSCPPSGSLGRSSFQCRFICRSACEACNTPSATERSVLLMLKAKNNYSPDSASEDHCTWNGVSCDEDGLITHLDLGSNQLSGSIPSQLGLLTNLQELGLGSNQLSGSIPSQLGLLTNLQNLYLDNNQLSGSKPQELGYLVNLAQLFLYNNQLSGSIPSQLGLLTNLQYLYLSGNQLNGSIPSQLGLLTNLQYLHLDSNQLSGSIPSQLGLLTNLQHLILNDNQLSGSIPQELGNLTNLANLFLNDNQLSGSIPSQLGLLTNLQYLYLDNNQLSGTIPQELGYLTNLVQFTLSKNQLSGSIPSQLGLLTNLQYLLLNDNQLSGTVPQELSALTKLIQYSIANNNFTNTCPFDENTCPPAGSIVNRSFLCRFICISACQACDVERNALLVLKAQNNYDPGFDTNGDYCMWNGVLCNANGSITALFLFQKQLIGSIPSQLGLLTNLQYLILYNNQLSGSIPSQLGSLTNLVTLALDDNQLSGTIPQQLSNLTNLVDFRFDNNPQLVPCYFTSTACPTTVPDPEGFICRWLCAAECQSCVIRESRTTGLVVSSSLDFSASFNPYFRHASFNWDSEFSTWRVLLSINRGVSIYSNPPVLLSRVKNQGQCASCWAFSAVAAVESLTAIATRSNAPQLSVQQVVSCQGSNGCNGGFPEAAFDYMTRRGLMDDSQLPYRDDSADTGVCASLATISPSIAMFERSDNWGWIGLLLALQQQPVVANLYGSHPSFINYGVVDGIYSDETCPTNSVDHSVLVTGYELANNKPYWWIQNSWGTGWGLGGTYAGFMKMAMTFGEGICGIHTTPIVYPVIASTSPCDSVGILSPCGDSKVGRCEADPEGKLKNKCRCIDSNFVAVTNRDLTQSCVLKNVCGRSLSNPCLVGKCVNDGKGSYSCVCPRNYNSTADSSPGCEWTGITQQLVVVPVGVSCLDFASTFQTTVADLAANNPQLDVSCGANWPGPSRLVNVPPSPSANCTVTYTWTKSDTCSSLTSYLQLSLQDTIQTLRALNPWMPDICGDYQPEEGTQVCISNDTKLDLPADALCTKYVTVKPSDTCLATAQEQGISFEALIAYNPGLICRDATSITSVTGMVSLPAVSSSVVCVQQEERGVPQKCSGPNKKLISAGLSKCADVAKYFQFVTFASLNGGSDCKNPLPRQICIPK